MPGMMNEEGGKPSTMRFMSVVSLFSSIGFATLTLIHPVASQGANGIYITFGFLIAAFAPKALQKFAENKVK